jgi:Ca2+-binding EF-hand superfamily protein
MLTELQARKLLKLFCMYDGDRDGHVVSQDFERIADKLADLKNLRGRSPKCLLLKDKFTQAWKQLVSRADSSRDQKVSLDEWLSYYAAVLSDEAKYTQEVQSFMRFIFDVFDDNGDGKISQSEWEQLFSVYGIHPAYAPTAFRQIDINQDGFLNREELSELIDDFFFGDSVDAVANAMFGPY